jgi:uncharacterized YigZ family protein
VADKVFTYKTIDQQGESMHRVMASKHLGIARHVTSEVEIKSLLENWKNEHHNANHVCYAWRLGWDKNKYRLSDDGEPSGTAGKPIYGQIVSADLTNVLVAVIRYFGGTKLGTGGLIDAYKTAAAQAIQSAIIVEREASQIIEVQFPYDEMPQIMSYLKALQMVKIEANMDQVCTMKIGLAGKMLAPFQNWADEQTHFKYELKGWI